jgi:solute carrier family 25 S-adenosylmethionine transporter 26
MWVLLLALSLCCILRATASSTNSTLSFTDVILAGAGARVFAQTLLHPLEVVRTRTQAFRGKTMPILPFRGKAGLLLKGIFPQMLLSGPAGALQFGALEIAKVCI